MVAIKMGNHEQFKWGDRVVIDNIGGTTKFDYASTKLMSTVNRHGKIASELESSSINNRGRLFLVHLDEDDENEAVEFVYFGNELRNE